MIEFLHNWEYLQALTMQNVCPERWEYPNLLGSGENRILSCFKCLLEYQSTIASLNTCWFLFPTPHIPMKMKGPKRKWQFFAQLPASSGSCWRKLPSCSSAHQWDQAVKYSRALTHPMCYGSDKSKLVLWAISNSFSFDCCQLPFSCGSALRTSKTLSSISLIFRLV